MISGEQGGVDFERKILVRSRRQHANAIQRRHVRVTFSAPLRRLEENHNKELGSDASQEQQHSKKSDFGRLWSHINAACSTYENSTMSTNGAVELLLRTVLSICFLY